MSTPGQERTDGGWVLCAPMRMEAAELRRALPGPAGTVLHTGAGRRRSERAAGSVALTDAEALAVAGVGGGLDATLKPGDVVVATEVRAAAWATGPRPATTVLPAAGMLAGALRRQGLTVRTGPVVSTERLARGTTRDRLAATGALAVDLESAWLLAGPAGRPAACVRVVADTGAVVRPGTLGQLRTALAALPAVAAGLSEWAAATTVRRVVLAAPRSFCAGVERAILVVERALELHGPPVYVRKQIVHNTHVVADLSARGAVFVDDVDDVPEGAVTVFSAHGVSPAVRSAATARQLSAIDATCPLVTKVHAEARRFAEHGDTILLIGHAGHEETDGVLGEAPDRIRLVQDVGDAEQVRVDDPRRVSYLVQTTLAVDDVADIVAVLRDRFPDLAAPPSDDICYATTNRQRAVSEVAAACDAMIVVGSANSSNSRRLVEVAERAGTPAYLVDGAAGIDLRWLAGVHTVGVSAGASAPPVLVDEVVGAMSGLGARAAHEHTAVNEDVQFMLPKEVRR
ncbi:4-hydroxy-3-methylbut-2-enyl diphosphate reductase [Dactylosporangium sp. AC04546]|nr:4-hydroxy-3-methylbut-2-enyl diphosphate reductase [Dactylosporangium sp. AC04546]WVK88822.1 4-hydroxy-3-methylbut-2-enyl diphosphate reductase [Dactylosporangium sp. AC04546]